MLLIYKGPDSSLNCRSFSYSSLQVAETVLNSTGFYLLLFISFPITVISFLHQVYTFLLFSILRQSSNLHKFTTYMFGCQFRRLWVLSFLASTLKLDYIVFLKERQVVQAGLPKAAVIFFPWKKKWHHSNFYRIQELLFFLLYTFNQINIFRISKYNSLKLLTTKDRIRCVIKIPIQILT